MDQSDFSSHCMIFYPFYNITSNSILVIPELQIRHLFMCYGNYPAYA